MEPIVSFQMSQLLSILGLATLLRWSEIKTYVGILSSCDSESKSHSRQRELAAMVGCPERTVRTYISRLEELGLIRAWRGPDGGNYYRVLPFPPSVTKAIRERIPDFDPSVGGQSHASRGRNSQTSPGGLLRNVDSAVPPSGDVLTNVSPSGADSLAGPASQGPGDGTGDAGWKPGDRLDSEIAEVLRSVLLKECPKDQAVVQLLMHLGFFHEGIIDDEALTDWLIEKGVNEIQAFGDLLEQFRCDSNSVGRTGLITLPMICPKYGMTTTIVDWLNTRMQHCLLGFLSFVDQGLLAKKSPDGRSYTELEIRGRVENFMREQGMTTLDELIQMGERISKEVIESRKSAK